MRFPVNNFKTEWNLTAGNGFGLPFLVVRIVPVIRRIMNFHMAIKADSSKVNGGRIGSVFIKMMYKKIYSSSHRLLFNSTKFAVFFEIFSIPRTPVFIITVFNSYVLSLKRFFEVRNSSFGNISTFGRTVFGHFPSINLKSWCNKWLVTKKTLKNIIHSTFWHSWFTTKPFPYEIIHKNIIYGLHEGVNV